MYSSLLKEHVSNSTHIDGLAADIYSDYVSVDELYDICDRVIGDRGDVGYYPSQGFIHVDLRGYRARWCAALPVGVRELVGG